MSNKYKKKRKIVVGIVSNKVTCGDCKHKSKVLPGTCTLFLEEELTSSKRLDICVQSEQSIERRL